MLIGSLFSPHALGWSFCFCTKRRTAHVLDRGAGSSENAHALDRAAANSSGLLMLLIVLLTQEDIAEGTLVDTWKKRLEIPSSRPGRSAWRYPRRDPGRSAWWSRHCGWYPPSSSCDKDWDEHRKHTLSDNVAVAVAVSTDTVAVRPLIRWNVIAHVVLVPHRKSQKAPWKEAWRCVLNEFSHSLPCSREDCGFDQPWSRTRKYKQWRHSILSHACSRDEMWSFWSVYVVTHCAHLCMLFEWVFCSHPRRLSGGFSPVNRNWS